MPSTLSSRDCSSDTYLMQPHAAIQLGKPSPGYFWSRGTLFLCACYSSTGNKSLQSSTGWLEGTFAIIHVQTNAFFFRKMHNTLPDLHAALSLSLSFSFFFPVFCYFMCSRGPRNSVVLFIFFPLPSYLNFLAALQITYKEI